MTKSVVSIVYPFTAASNSSGWWIVLPSLTKVSCWFYTKLISLHWCWHRKTWTPQLRHSGHTWGLPPRRENQRHLGHRSAFCPRSGVGTDVTPTNMYNWYYRDCWTRLSEPDHLSTATNDSGSTWNRSSTRFEEWRQRRRSTCRSWSNTRPCPRGLARSSKWPRARSTHLRVIHRCT